MDRNGPNNNGQLGFDALLGEAEADNRKRVFERKTAHLPGTMSEAVIFHREQIKAHHAAMLACDFDAAFAIRDEAHLLARKLNGDRSGIIADDSAPGCVLAREAAAPDGQIPLWGQDGRFTLHVSGIPISVHMSGMFGVCATSMRYAGFGVQAVDFSRPFLSQTGFRSFMGASVSDEPGLTPERFTEGVVAHFIDHDLRGRLVWIEDRFHPSSGKRD